MERVATEGKRLTNYTAGGRRNAAVRHRLVAGCPGAGGQCGDSTDGEVSQAREYRTKIIANWDMKSATSFNDRDNSRNAWTSLLAADVDPILASKGNRTDRVLGPVIG